MAAPDRSRGSTEPTSAGATAPLDSLKLAVAFLTVVRIRLRGQAPPLGSSAVAFPVVGGLVGAVAGGVGYLLEPSLGPTLAAIFGAGVLVGITGALHQDGLADCCDGLGVRGDRKRRLEVMRDSSVGTFGALGLIFWLALFVSAVAGLDRGDALRAFVVACSLGRWAALVHASTSSPARPDGLGAEFAVRGRSLAVSALLAAVVAVGLDGVDGLVVLAASAGVGLLISAWSRRSLGGRTGDTLGACVAIAEVCVAVVMLALNRG
jgi:adenosylcobinamide-GDP ribazoletransferase